MSTIKLGRAGVLSEVSYQQVDITRGAIRVTGNVHVADATDMTYAVEQISALVDNPDETFVPVRTSVAPMEKNDLSRLPHGLPGSGK